MSSEAEQLAAKLAEIAGSRKKKEEHRQQMELEVEQERLEEERLREELERMRVEEQRKQEAAKAAAEEPKKAEEFVRMEHEVLLECRRLADVREAQWHAEAEAEKGKKRDREESEIEVMVGSLLEEGGVVWRTKEGRICDGCAKSGVKCFWRDDSRWAKACRECNTLKRLCTKDGVGQKGLEAGPSKKRKVDKGKGKEKEVDMWEHLML
ncbi:hypothetical protein PILCRDRAFT_9628 [Piloderma croceum F 1598]|uniref:Uncharacterized protein n=1 Tax=Piloderma croceum (strain F 1598) TaxID=765440 RepID=A0A0C3FLP2_PILCF|nr:hypothetical protein PILCRDRAFT_9628 [Piloderma croceum F 1598]